MRTFKFTLHYPDGNGTFTHTTTAKDMVHALTLAAQQNAKFLNDFRLVTVEELP